MRFLRSAFSALLFVACASQEPLALQVDDQGPSADSEARSFLLQVSASPDATDAPHLVEPRFELPKGWRVLSGESPLLVDANHQGTYSFSLRRDVQVPSQDNIATIHIADSSLDFNLPLETQDLCGSCQANFVCCSSGPCSGNCVPDCRLGGSCPGGTSCDQNSGVCTPSGAGGAGGLGGAPQGGSGGALLGGSGGASPQGGSSGSSGSSSSCDACQASEVCCTVGGCSGTCVPDCRQGGSCPDNLSCDQDSGVCLPAGGAGGQGGSGGAPPQGGASGAPSQGGASGAPPQGGSGGAPPQGGSSGSSGSSSSCDACQASEVCCTVGGCSGTCVPDCRQGGSCPDNLSCDQDSGVCLPAGGAGGAPSQGGSGGAPSQGGKGGAPPQGGMGGALMGGKGGAPPVGGEGGAPPQGGAPPVGGEGGAPPPGR